MSVTVQWLVGVAAGLTAVGVIWRKFLRPVAKGASVIAEATPVLLEIADKYKPNGGGSLPEVLDRVDRTLADHVTNMGVLGESVTTHIAADTKAFAEVVAAQTLAAAMALEIAIALKSDTAVIAAKVKAEAEETAVALKTVAEGTAASLKTETEGTAAAVKTVAEDTASALHTETADIATTLAETPPTPRT